MTNRYQETAEKIVATFKRNIDAELCRQIGEEQFNLLEIMIRDGITRELNVVTEQIEEIVRDLRASADKPELAM